jgi:hypothetical protein
MPSKSDLQLMNYSEIQNVHLQIYSIQIYHLLKCQPQENCSSVGCIDLFFKSALDHKILKQFQHICVMYEYSAFMHSYNFTQKIAVL